MESASNLGSDSACGENGHAGDIDDDGGDEERNLQGRILEEEVFLELPHGSPKIR